MFDHATLPPRFVPTFSDTLRQWVVYDASDGHETPCTSREVAAQCALLCEGARRLAMAKSKWLVPLWTVA